MKRSLAIILSISICFPAYAADVKYVKEGEPVPYTGYLFTPEKEKELRLLDDKLSLSEQKINLLKSTNELQTQLIDNGNKRIEIYQKQVDYLGEKVVSTEDKSFWKSTLYFTLGAVLTGAVAYGLSQGYRR